MLQLLKILKIFLCLFFVIKICIKPNTMENLKKMVNQGHLSLLTFYVPLMSSRKFGLPSTGNGISFGPAFMPQLVV